jgi:hypothetical protein
MAFFARRVSANRPAWNTWFYLPKIRDDQLFFNARTFNMQFNARLQDHPIVISLPELQAELSTLKVAGE